MAILLAWGMAQFTRDGLTLAYDEFGPGNARKAIVLVHGFSSNRYENWKRMGWYDAIAGKGLRGLALDCRGHGESAKPHDPAAYDRRQMAGDVFALMDHVGIERAHLLGFSMGAHIALTARRSASGYTAPGVTVIGSFFSVSKFFRSMNPVLPSATALSCVFKRSVAVLVVNRRIHQASTRNMRVKPTPNAIRSFHRMPR